MGSLSKIAEVDNAVALRRIYTQECALPRGSAPRHGSKGGGSGSTDTGLRVSQATFSLTSTLMENSYPH